jgi:glutathione synthase
MHVVVVMDPPHTVIVDEDTSFALMLAAQTREHRVDHCLMSELFMRKGAVHARVRPATMRRVASHPIELGAPEEIALADVDVVLVRSDPPFDEMYLWGTQMLERLRGETLVVNDPRGLRDANEKLYACHFPELMTDTLVTNDKARIKKFVDEVGGSAVIKPLSGAGGAGVMGLRAGDTNINAIIEATTQSGRRYAMVQRYIPEVVQGDKRILLLDGEPLGAILRVPQSGDVRSNIHVGGSVVKAEITPAEQHMIDTLAPRLLQDGLYFVGLDVIGGKLTEINVTSPTGIQQMSRLDGVNYSARVIEWIAQRA